MTSRQVNNLFVNPNRITSGGATNGQHLVWNASTGRWEGQSISMSQTQEAGQTNYSTAVLDNFHTFTNAPLSAAPSFVIASTINPDGSYHDGQNIRVDSQTDSVFIPGTGKLFSDLTTESTLVDNINEQANFPGSTKPIFVYCTNNGGVYSLHARKSNDVLGSDWSARETIATDIFAPGGVPLFSVALSGGGSAGYKVLFGNAAGAPQLASCDVADDTFTWTVQALASATVFPATTIQLQLAIDSSEFPVYYYVDDLGTPVVNFSYQSATPDGDGTGTWAAASAVATTAFSAEGPAFISRPIRLASNLLALAVTQPDATTNSLRYYASATADGAGAYTEILLTPAAIVSGASGKPHLLLGTGNTVGIMGSSDANNLFRHGFTSAAPAVAGDLAAAADVPFALNGGIRQVFSIDGLPVFAGWDSGTIRLARATDLDATGFSAINTDYGSPTDVEGFNVLQLDHLNPTSSTPLAIWKGSDSIVHSVSTPGILQYVAYA